MINEKKYISWRRVSTFRQNKSGLGLEAQKEIIRYFIERDKGDWLADYSECYTGTELSGCVELRKAIEHCKRENATLIIAKTDRFRNTIEALQVYEELGDGHIMFCDLPHTDKFTLTLFFALAEREALIVSIRTKQALDAKRARGEETGGTSKLWGKKTGANRDEALQVVRTQSAKARRERMKKEPANVFFWNYIVSQRENGREFDNIKDFERLSNELNRLNQSTPKGLPYNACRAWAVYRKLEKVYC